MKILIVDNDAHFSDQLSALLSERGYSISLAQNGEDGLQKALLSSYDLFIAECVLPLVNGGDFIRQLRDRGCDTPILVLSSYCRVEDRVYCLNSGADYFLSKPVDFRELLACIRSLLRRTQQSGIVLNFGDLTLNVNTCRLYRGEVSTRLSAKEFHIMRILLQAQDRIVAKDTILSRVWGGDSNAVENHVEVYIGLLRKKIRSLDSIVSIETVRRMGYHLVADKQ